MRADHPHADPGDGRTECETCGKWVWLVTHSCKRVPVTPAAVARHQERLAMPATDPLAHERFRTIITEALHENGIDEGREDVAHVIAPEFPRTKAACATCRGRTAFTLDDRF